MGYKCRYNINLHRAYHLEFYLNGRVNEILTHEAMTWALTPYQGFLSNQKLKLMVVLVDPCRPKPKWVIFVLCAQKQVYPNSWTAVYMPLDNVGMWNIRSENWARQYLGQQFYLRVYSPANSWRDEYPIPSNALLCGQAAGRSTRLYTSKMLP